MGLFALALALRLAALWLLAPTPLMADEHYYMMTAARLHELGLGWILDPTAPLPVTGPPVAPVLYGLGFSALGEPGLRALVAVLSALAVLPVVALGERLGGRRTGLAAGALMAVHPTLLTYARQLWTEPLFLFLSATGLALALRPGHATRHLGVAGLLVALAALTREVGLLLPGVALLVAWARPEPPRALVRGVGLAALLFALLVGGWSRRVDAASEVDQGFVSTVSVLNLYIGNVGRPPYESLGPTPEARAEEARRRVEAALAEEGLPAWAWRKASLMTPRFFEPGGLPQAQWSAPLDKPWAARPRLAFLAEPGPRSAVAWLSTTFRHLLTGLGLGGLALAALAKGPPARRRLALALLAWIVATWAPTVISFAKPRFAVPVQPALALGAAWLLAGGDRPALLGALREAGWPARAGAAALGAWGLYIAWPG